MKDRLSFYISDFRGKKVIKIVSKIDHITHTNKSDVRYVGRNVVVFDIVKLDNKITISYKCSGLKLFKNIVGVFDKFIIDIDDLPFGDCKNVYLVCNGDGSIVLSTISVDKNESVIPVVNNVGRRCLLVRNDIGITNGKYMVFVDNLDVVLVPFESGNFIVLSYGITTNRLDISSVYDDVVCLIDGRECVTLEYEEPTNGIFWIVKKGAV